MKTSEQIFLSLRKAIIAEHEATQADEERAVNKGIDKLPRKRKFYMTRKRRAELAKR